MKLLLREPRWRAKNRSNLLKSHFRQSALCCRLVVNVELISEHCRRNHKSSSLRPNLFSVLLTFITFKCLRKRTRCVDIHLKAVFLYRIIQGKASLQKLLEFEEPPRLSVLKWTFFRRNFSVFFADVYQDIKLCFNIEGFFLESKLSWSHWKAKATKAIHFRLHIFLGKLPWGELHKLFM